MSNGHAPDQVRLPHEPDRGARRARGSLRHRAHRPRRSASRLALTALAVAALSLAGMTAATGTGAATPSADGAQAHSAASAPHAAPNDVPAPPDGFTTTWSDDFNGAAGTGVPASDWKYDTGPGSSFGTGEIETMTDSTSNVYEDGDGHLVLKALHDGSDPGSGWTSGRIETQADSFGAPPRRRGDDAVLDPAAGPDHGRRRGLLAGVLDARLDAARRRDLAAVR